MSGALDRFFDHYYRRRPVNATFTGMHAFDDKLPDWSAAGLEALDDEIHGLTRELSLTHPAPSSPRAYRDDPTLLDAELARSFLETQLAENASSHGVRRNPSLWTGEAIFSIVSLMIRDFAPLDARIENVGMRLDAISHFLQDATVTLGYGGIPRQWVDRALRELAGAEILLTRGIDRWLASDVHTAKSGARLRAAAEGARVAFAAFGEWLRAMPAPADEGLACGAAMFDTLLARGHQCSRSRADLLVDARGRLGTERAKLDVMARDIGQSSSSLQGALAADAPLPDDYFGTFQRFWRECHSSVTSRHVVTWPDWPIDYVPIPPWAAEAAPYLYFLYYRSPAPFDAYSTHDYVVPDVPTTGQHAFLHTWNNSVIRLNHVIHHGGLGHHVQNWHAYHRARTRIGKIAAVDCASRIGMFCGGTMAEGWACYATHLMDELDLLTPLETLAEQHSRIRFLARAVVDIELHQGTMSFDDAARLYIDTAGLSEATARAEVVKNSMFPCTAVMYWLGTQGIIDLRETLRANRGAAFSLEAFHDELLAFGSIPIPLVSRIMSEQDG